VVHAIRKFRDARAHDMINSSRGLLAAVNDIEKSRESAVDVSIA